MALAWLMLGRFALGSRRMSRSQLDRFQQAVVDAGASGMAYLTVTEAGIQSRLKNGVGEETVLRGDN